MKKPTEAVLKALCNLEGNPDFETIQRWFLESASDEDNVLRTANDGPTLYRSQGASACLLEFCDYASRPKVLIGKLGMKQAGIHPFPT